MRRESLIGTKASAQRPGAAVVANPSDGIGLPGDSRFGMLLSFLLFTTKVHVHIFSGGRKH